MLNNFVRKIEKDSDGLYRYFESLESINLTTDETLFILGKESIDEEICTVRYKFASDSYRLLWWKEECKMLYSDYEELKKELIDEERVRKIKQGEDPKSVAEEAVAKIRERSDESMVKVRKKLGKV